MTKIPTLAVRTLSVRVAFFSGTGCARLVAETFAAELRARGAEAVLWDLRAGAPEPQGPWDLLVVCYAVHACNAPAPVERWAERLEAGAGRRAALVSVSGGGAVTPNLACRVGLSRRLRRRGWKVDWQTMIAMPSNWIVRTKPALAARLLEVLPRKASFAADELIAGAARRSRAGPGNRLLSLIGKAERWGAREFGRRLGADGRCAGCGVCARGCPAGNIALVDGRPVFGAACVLCLYCVYACPARAITPGVGKFVLVPEGFSLKDLIAGPPSPPDLDLAAEAKGYLWLGVKRYLLEAADQAEPRSAGSARPAGAPPSS